MTRRLSPSRLLLLTAALGALAACSDTPDPAGLDHDELVTSFQVQDGAGDYLVAFAPGRLAAASRAVSQLGGSVVRSHPQVNLLLAGGLSAEAAAALSGTRGIQEVLADFSIEASPEMELAVQEIGDAAHDPSAAGLFAFQWDMQIIDADDAWAAGATAEGTTVAILDSGIDPVHPDLAGLVDAGRSIAFVANANPLIPEWSDDRFHGTHVAGTVATNGIGTAGVAPHATLMSVKVCDWTGSCPFSAIIAGMLHATDNGADVINLSLGGLIDRSAEGAGEFNGFLNRVFNYANQRGVAVVSAAGNSALDLDHLGRDYGAGPFLATPCESGNGVCVSATNIADDLAAYSNYGKAAVSLAAPGGDGLLGIQSTVLAPCATGSVFLPLVGINCGPSSYLWASGTSMASPHVAGAAALLAAQGMNSGQIKSVLQRTADDLGAPGADATYSKGRLNVMSAWSN